MNLLLSLVGRSLALFGVLLAAWFGAVWLTQAMVVVEDPLAWDGGGGLASVGVGLGVYGLGGGWLALMALLGLAGAAVGSVRGWMACLTLHLPALADFVLAAAASVAVGLQPWADPIAIALVAVPMALPGLVLFTAGMLLWWLAKRNADARFEAAVQEAAASREAA